jgi:hypothetical protein|tara:strand:+ start:86 stop:265 length:180 start_codon:yes stop_codon:yes gene_type:complete
VEVKVELLVVVLTLLVVLVDLVVVEEEMVELIPLLTEDLHLVHLVVVQMLTHLLMVGEI